MQTVGYFVEPQFTFTDRVWMRLFPVAAISEPEMPHRDMFVCRTRVKFSWLDRLRIVMTGKAMVETRTVTENEIGAHKTASVAYPIR